MLQKYFHNSEKISPKFHCKETFAIFAPLQARNMDNAIFELVVLEEARTFLKSLSLSVRTKIAYNIRKIQLGFKDAELFKKLDDTEGIWEFRTLYQGISYRLFAFWDTEGQTLVVATNGIIKKTQKTSSKDIAKAEGIRRRYFEAKKDIRNETAR